MSLCDRCANKELIAHMPDCRFGWRYGARCRVDGERLLGCTLCTDFIRKQKDKVKR